MIEIVLNYHLSLVTYSFFFNSLMFILGYQLIIYHVTNVWSYQRNHIKSRRIF